MKPKFYFRTPDIFTAKLKYGVPVAIGFSVLIGSLNAQAGDLLRGGSSSGNKPSRGAAAGARTPDATDAARANARDALARTSHALAAARNLQNAARNAAIRNGAGPNKPTFTLPKVPNGLIAGGLKPTVDPTKWTGANLPVQRTRNGKTKVTITQTEQQALLHWETLNVGEKTTLTFDQKKGGANAGQWIAFNRITDPSGSPTQILGNIEADGQVYLINSNGIIFGGGSTVHARNLTASSLPISSNLIQRGLLNNPGSEFLFDGLGLSGKTGDVTVEAGARLISPVSADGNGGRVFLAGANVTNKGAISTPAGQTILAAGLQVGILAHAGNDPAIRGLDAYVGAIADPASGVDSQAGTATNLGLIEAARGNITITGKSVNQAGVVESSTTVSLNGSVTLSASYRAVRNAGYLPENPSTGNAFNYTAAGTVTFGEGSVTRILPDYQSKDTATGTALALRSQIDAQGKNIYLAKDSEIFAPNAEVSFKTGTWTDLPSGPFSTFLQSGGQIYLDGGARINLAGTVDASASVRQNYLTVTLRGSELSVAPLQRDGVLRGDTIVVDITKTGTYNGNDWVGTPLADVSGYLNLIERNVAQLTTAGGTLDLSAGGSVVIRNGAKIDVSGGWTKFTGDTVQTTRLWTNGRLIDIASATPDQVYGGIFTGSSTITIPKWGVSETFLQALAPSGKRYQDGFTQGASAGGISISTPSVALDGSLLGNSVAGALQLRPGSGGSRLPATGSLTLKLEGQLLSGSVIYTHSPTQPNVVFGNGKLEDVADFNPDSSELSAERNGTIYLSEALVSRNGFGNLTVVNEGGDILLPEDVTLTSQAGSRLSLSAANIDLLGAIISPGSALSFNALNLTSYERALLLSEDSTPPANVGRGVITLGSSAVLDTKGTLTDDRVSRPGTLAPIALNGGSISIAGFSADLRAGGLIDVSGGYLLDSAGKGTFGTGGSITIEAGKDKASPTVIGGTLSLESTLLGFAGSGKKGGTLSLQAPHIQVGGISTNADTLLLQPGFFSRGGFSDFKLTGLGIGSRPGVLVSAGTLLAPVVKSFEAEIRPAGGGTLSLRPIQDLIGSRTPVSLTLASPVLRSLTTVELGDVIVEKGAVIRTDPGGAVTLTGGTVSILGSIITPGGTISAGGESTSVLDPSSTAARVTTFIGSDALLSATGAVILTPDEFGRRSGRVLAGGRITLTGNIAASTGAVLDVSGTSAIFDIDPDTASPDGPGPMTGPGLISLPKLVASVPARVDGNAGSIILQGNEMLLTDATLRGNAGGSSAAGGSLTVSSRIYSPLEIPLPSTINLRVSQTGARVVSGIGASSLGGGRFAVDAFSSGGFDSLALNGVVAFEGAVNIAARRELSVASGGFLYAEGAVKLTAPHVTLGLAQSVVLPANEASPFSGSVLPTSGTGDLTINADLIDLGHLSLQQIAKAALHARSGDIRGSGTFQIAGDLTLNVGQIYPRTASKLTFIAYDTTTRESRIDVLASGTRSLPLSAGGTLSFYGSTISQSGTIRAPFGTINLGWDGTGTRPLDLLAGSGAGGVFPITKNLTLGTGSVTSVSAVDPRTGKGVTIPYGISTDGEDWIDPRGADITGIGTPEKNVVLAGVSVTTAKGSTIDLRGGGDLYAYRWVKGLGGLSDILAADTSFAVIASYNENFAPVADNNTSDREENLISGFKGYTNGTLAVGDRVYLSASDSLPAGYYTLLPARYALLPGAVLVTPTGGSGSATVEMPDSSSVVSGYRYNSLNSALTPSTISSRFEVAAAAVVRARAQYENFLGNRFFKTSGGADLRLPLDSGHLVFQASQAMEILGTVASSSIAKGRGASIDISTPLATVITSGARPPSPGTIALDSETLNSFGAESLLIGGRRTRSAVGTEVSITASSVTVDNRGSMLAAQDLMIVANDLLVVEDGSSLASTGSRELSENLVLSGNGALLRLSSDPNAGSSRTGISSATSPLLSIGADVKLKGGSITLDSSAGIFLNSAARLAADSYQFNAGNIALLLGNVDPVTSSNGLVISNDTLRQLQVASELRVLSYSSIDLHGSGTFGSISDLASLTLSAGEIKGLNTSGAARISAGVLRLENSAAASSTVATGPLGGNLELVGETIELGINSLSINGYSSVLLDATRGIIGEDTGGLTVQGNLTAKTPVLAGAAGAIRTLSAGGIVSIDGPRQKAAGSLVSGLGSTLTVTGRTVDVDTTVSLPSGSLNLRATAGHLTIGGILDISGTVQKFHDVTRLTSAGNIVLAASLGNVVLKSGSKVDLSSRANGGTLSVKVPDGAFASDGSITAEGGNDARNGSFALDVLSLPSLAELNSSLSSAKLTDTQTIRVRNGDVLINGTATTQNFYLSADRGSIDVTGTIDASGKTGGSIHLAARGDLTTRDKSSLTVAGDIFNNAGKGGSITLESGTQLDGLIGSGSLNIQAGSKLNLSVASRIDGPASDPGTSAFNGQFSGKLHLRAPRTAANNDLLVRALDGTIVGASSILVEGYKLYELTTPVGTITSVLQTTIRNDNTAYLGAAGTTIANYTNISDRLLANNSGLKDRLVLAPGVEIINRSGDLTLGTPTSTTTSDWNLSTDRYGHKAAAGVLTLRAAGNLHFYNALSDGFTPTLASNDNTWLWTARLAVHSDLLPVNQQSWSYRLTAGADLSSASFGEVVSLTGLAVDKGSLKLGKTGTNISIGSGVNATTATAIANRFQVIRTGSGDIDIHAARDVQLLNQFSTIYTAGTRVADVTLGGLFRIPLISNVSSGALGGNQQTYSVQYSMAGGNVNIHAGEDIERLTLTVGQLVPDSQLQMPTNWLYRRGYVDETGKFGTDRFNFATSTTWWVDFSNFFQGVGALGGGNATLVAGRNVSNVDAVIPTNARMPGYTDVTQTNNAAPDLSKMVELGGGDLVVRAGNDIDAGVYYVERGTGALSAGGEILTNATRTVLNRTQTLTSSFTQLPTTLFLGKGSFDIAANGNVLLGPVANPFLLPAGQLNSFYNKSYFSTYSVDSSVSVSSLGGDVTLRESAAEGGITALPLLRLWYENKLRLTTLSASANKPWLRLAETSIDPFSTLFTLQPGTVKATSFSANINLVGNLLLSPSAQGNVSFLARNSISALQPNGVLNLNGVLTTSWGSSRINLSDSDPAAIPGVANPYGYQTLVGTSTAADTTTTDFLGFLNQRFAESGGTLGNNVTLETKQNLHAPGLLHAADREPVRLYASSGDISGLVLFSPKSARVIAGQDIADISFYIQNTQRTDTSIVSSGRDLLPFTQASVLRDSAVSAGNILNGSSFPLDGDIQISGPGTLQVLAGRDLDLGTGSNNADGTGTGITSIGNTRNPYLPETGANLLVAAGIGAASGLSVSDLNIADFIQSYVLTKKGAKYLNQIAPGVEFETLQAEEQARLAIGVFNRILRDAGRSFAKVGNYRAARAAIQVLFGDKNPWDGDILTRSRDIRTSNGGDIDILTPGGGLTLASTTTGSTLAPPGIITASGGSISIFANNDVNIGIGRIFTLRGGDEIIWSSEGDIAAGSSSKTVQTASPTRVRIDPQSATVQTDLSGLATGGGIGVLNTVKGVKPGNVDLIAPKGTVDAGDAGIRVSGNLNIAANQVLNAANISVSGSSAGTPAPVSAATSVSAVTTASNSAAAVAATTQPAAPRSAETPVETEDTLSIITVEVIGYGGDEDDDEKKDEIGLQ